MAARKLLSLPESPSSFSSISQQHHPGFSQAAIIGISAIGAGLLLLTISLIILYLKRLRTSRTSPHDLPVQKFSYRELKSATCSFSADMKIGKGGFGVVYRGILRSSEVAIKRLDITSADGEHEFQNELLIAGRLRSEFIVRLLGYCAEAPRRRLLVFEFMRHGSLQEALFNHPKLLDWRRRFTVICDIAKALKFLHLECEPPIIHGDVKPSNVLLDADFHARLADFGLARLKFPQTPLVNVDDVAGEEQAAAAGEEEVADMAGDVYFSAKTEPQPSTPSGKLRYMFEVEDFCYQSSGDNSARKSCSLMSGEISAKDYILDWIGAGGSRRSNNDGESVEELRRGGRKKKRKVAENCRDVRVVAKKKARDSPREWWREDYFNEMSAGKRARKSPWKKNLQPNMNFPRSFDEQLEILRGQRSGAARFMSRPDKGELSFGRSSNGSRSLRESDLWSGDLPSRDLSSTTSMRGTVCYIPPEYRGSASMASEKGDIYSLGVLILVIVSGRRPLNVQVGSPMKKDFFERANLVSWAKQLAQNGKILELVSDALAADFDRKQAELCIIIALLCLQRDPELRPGISEVLQMLHGDVDPPCLPLEFSPSPQSGSRPYRKSKSRKKNAAAPMIQQQQKDADSSL